MSDLFNPNEALCASFSLSNKDEIMKFGYTIIYVENVLETVAFYEKAFGLPRRFIHESNLYAEMETGDTALTFAGEEAAELSNLAITPNRKDKLSAGWEICLVCEDVHKAYAHAVENGALPLSPPEEKPWNQTVSYVKDLNGCLVEIASPVRK